MRPVWVMYGMTVAIATSVGQAQIEFVEVGVERGIGAYDAGPGYGTGVAAADFDDDGDIDLFVANGPGVPDQVYRNRGDGFFDEVAADLGLASTGPSRTALWVDFDGDGRLDLVVAGDCYADPACPSTATIRVHRQTARGDFEDVSDVVAPDDDAITASGQHRSGLAAGDLDGDGRLDLVVGVWGGGRAMLLHNAGGRRFVDVGVAAGIVVRDDEDQWQPAILDVDRDGAPDVFWAVDFTANRLWMNRRDGTFVDAAAAAGLDNAMNDMGVGVGDYDNDGDLDLYVTEITDFDDHNVLFRNDTVDGAVAFAEVAVAAGVDDTNFGWGCAFLDADNDGWLDLAVTNGWFNGVGYEDPSRFFRNLGSGPRGVRFEEIGAEAGFDDREWGASLVAFDMDRDGDLDLVQTCNLGGPLRLLENRSPAAAGHHFLVIRPRMSGPNRRAIGAVVQVEVDGAIMTRPIEAGTSHLGQAPAEAAFGLGRAGGVDRVVIAWPDGAQTVRELVAADRVMTIERSACPGTADLDGDGEVGFDDLLRLLSRWGPCPTACPHDVDGDGVVGATDLATLLDQWGVCG